MPTGEMNYRRMCELELTHPPFIGRRCPPAAACTGRVTPPELTYAALLEMQHRALGGPYTAPMPRLMSARTTPAFWELPLDKQQ